MKLAKVTIKEVDDAMPRISQFGEYSIPIQDIVLNNSENLILIEKFRLQYGSGLASVHNYQVYYASLFDKNTVGKVLKIGLGTSNPNNSFQYGQKWKARSFS